MRESYNGSRARKIDHYNDIRRKRRLVQKTKFDDWKHERGCSMCSENDPACLDLHHLDPKEKEGVLSGMMDLAWDVIMMEASKCVVVCRNCHAKIHAGRDSFTHLLINEIQNG